MIPKEWPWTWEEEAKWQEELHRDECGWMEDLLNHLIHDRTDTASYDPMLVDEEIGDSTLVR
jgi:hypothetical protein